jgi:hypothetical protein
MARGKHLFPFRTEPLSPSAPMVLGPQGPGRVGRRRFFFKGPACALAQAGPFRKTEAEALLDVWEQAHRARADAILAENGFEE